MKLAVVRWLEFAEIDLKAAKTLLEEGSLSSVVCFHAQQSFEKCLKGSRAFVQTTRGPSCKLPERA